MFGCGSVKLPLRFGSPLPAETVDWSRLNVVMGVAMPVESKVHVSNRIVT